MLEGGTPASPDRAEPWYRARLRIGSRDAHDTLTVVVLPRSGYLGGFEAAGSSYDWMQLTGRGAALYRRLTRDLEPFPAARLAGIGEPDRPAAAQPASEDALDHDPASDQASDADGTLIAGGVAGAVLLAALGISVLRRRRS